MSKDFATKRQLDDLKRQMVATETAIGFILASLSKQVDMKTVFEDAVQEAERLNATFTARKVITSIRDTVQLAEEGQHIEVGFVIL